MYCKYCGNELEDASLFCNKCGKAQSEKKQSSKDRKEKVKLSSKEKGIRLVSWIILIAIYFIAFVTTVYLLIYGGGIVPGVLIFAVALVYQLTLFKKARMKSISNITKKCIRRLTVIIVYFILPIAILVGAFEYSYYVTIGNSSAVAQRYVENSLKSNLKNPQSLQIHNIGFKDELEDDDNKYFYVEIEYSAQNGLGGFNRDTYKKYVQVGKKTGNAYELSQQEYKNKSIEIRDNEIKEKYAEKLKKINPNLYLNYICDSNTSYSEIAANLNADNSWEINELKDGIELTKEVSFDKFDGELLMYFEKNSQSLRKIEFMWASDIVFYDKKNNTTKRIGEFQTASVKDIEKLEKLIFDNIGIDKEDISGKNDSLYTNTYLWKISDNVNLTLEWDKPSDDSQQITLFRLICVNDK